MGKVAEHMAADLTRALRRNPVIPAVRTEGEPLEEALGGDHPAVFVLGGDIFKLTRKIATVEPRPPVFVNVDLMGGVNADMPGLEFLYQHVEGVISTNRHVIEMANSVGLVTIQRLFALDLSTIERGLKLVRRAKPRYVEVLPALAYPLMAARHPEVLDWPVVAGGLLKSWEEVSHVLEAGVAGVSTSHRELWRRA